MYIRRLAHASECTWPREHPHLAPCLTTGYNRQKRSESVFFIGCPMWGYKEWVGNFFPAHTAPKDFLRIYSQQLNVVEGNTTFYALPSAETIVRWRQETPTTFRFCPKISRDISHSSRLDEQKRATLLFIERMRGLAHAWDPSFYNYRQHLHQIR